MLRYLALATDYDGTLAHDGRVEESTIKALERLKESDRRLLLVTGRQLQDLERVFPEYEIFDRIVAENGLVIHRPRTKETLDLAGSPREELLEALRERDVPFRVGRSIIGTERPHEIAALEAIRDVGLELQIVFNKKSVMIVPSGHNKATGMQVALREMRLSPHNVVGIGDAENDHAFLTDCECSVATANAVETLKERSDHVTKGERGAGVEELIEAMLDDDLHSLESELARRRIVIGRREDDDDGAPVWFEPHDRNVLVAGPSGSGKSSATTSIIERLAKARYQFLLIDPEGDYESFEGAVVLGDMHRAPGQSEVLAILENPENNLVVNLLDVPLADRPMYFDGLMGRVAEFRAGTGRPHWIVIDEAHHLLPAERGAAGITLPKETAGVVMITVHPERIAKPALEAVDTLLAVGPDPRETVQAFADALGEDCPEGVPESQDSGRAVAWLRRGDRAITFEVAPAKMERRRHRRKYAEGELKPERSFWFTGPDGRLNLRAQNLQLFVQIGDGVDDETWLHHLRNGDVEGWFSEMIKDEDLAAVAEELRKQEASAADSRERIHQAIERAYTLPA